MYIPRAFQETRIPVMHDFIDAHPFATVVSVAASGLTASHIPLVLERGGTELGVLRGHLSRANPQWRELSPEVEVLAIFGGPHHYISPSWYPEKSETGKVVPTWNYSVVHVYGRVTIYEDGDWLQRHLTALTDIHEGPMPTPWRVTDAPEQFVRAMVKGIVGLELNVTRLEGKWKASQNRSEGDQRGAAEGLGELGTESSLAMKSMIEARGRSKGR